MFAPYCPIHGSKVLLGVESISSIRPTSGGLAVEFTCSCGHRRPLDGSKNRELKLQLLRTGNRRLHRHRVSSRKPPNSERGAGKVNSRFGAHCPALQHEFTVGHTQLAEIAP